MIKTILTASIFLFNAANDANADIADNADNSDNAVDKYDCSRVQLPLRSLGGATLPDDDNPDRITFPISAYSAVHFTLNQGIKSKEGAYCLAVTEDAVLIASSDGNIVYRLLTTNVSFNRPNFVFSLYQNMKNNKCDVVLTYFDKNQHINWEQYYQKKFWTTNETGIGSIELNNFGQLVFSVNGKVIQIVGLYDFQVSGKYCSHVQFPVNTVGGVVTLPDDKNPHRILFGIEHSAVQFTLNQGIKSQNGAYCLTVVPGGIIIASRYGKIVYRVFTSKKTNESFDHVWLTNYQANYSENSRIWRRYDQEWHNYNFSSKHTRQRISITNETGICSMELTNIGQLRFLVNGTVIDAYGLIDPDVSGKTTTKRLNEINDKGIWTPNGICNLFVVGQVLTMTTYKYNPNQTAYLQDLYTVYRRNLNTFEIINRQIRITDDCTLQRVFDDNVQFRNLFLRKDTISKNGILTYGHRIYSRNMSCILQMRNDGDVIIDGGPNVKTLYSAKSRFNNNQLFFSVTERLIAIIEANQPGVQKRFSGDLADYTVLKSFVDGFYFDVMMLSDNCEMILQM